MAKNTRPGKAEARALELSVFEGFHNQFSVRNIHEQLKDFDREYVEFSGYFGPHGPHVFAAAPLLLAVVVDLLRPLEMAATMLQAQGKVLDDHVQASFDRARTALAKARGEV